MDLLYKPDFERVKEYWRAFWEKEVIDRPLISVTSPKNNVEQKMPRYLAGIDGDYIGALKQYEAHAATTYFGGEAIPSFEITLGPDQFAAFLGAELEHLKDINTTWVKPNIKNWKDVSFKLDPNNPSWAHILSFYKESVPFSEGKFLLNMLDLHSNMDCLSAMRDPAYLCMDLLDRQDEVEAALHKVRNLYPQVFEAIYEAGDMKNRGSIGWAPTYCEGKFAVVQCDFSCMISPDMARRFVIPAIAEEATYLDHCVYHYDGKEALGHLDDVLAIKEIDVIQWVPGDGNPRSVEWMDLLKKIQKAGKGLWIYDWTIDEIKQFYKELRPEGLLFQVQAKSQDEADEAIEWLRKNT